MEQCLLSMIQNKHCLCVAELSCSCLCYILLSIFYPVHFQCHEISPRVPLRWRSFSAVPISSGASSFFLSRPLFFNTDPWFPLPQVPPAAYLESLKQQQGQHSHRQQFFCDSVCVWFKFHFQGYHFSLFCYPCIFLGQFPLQFSIFAKCYVGLSLGNEKITQLHALLTVQTKKQMCTDQLLKINADFKINDMISYWSWCVNAIYIAVAWRARSKLCYYAIIHS